MQEKLGGLTKRIITRCQSLNNLTEDEFHAQRMRLHSWKPSVMSLK